MLNTTKTKTKNPNRKRKRNQGTTGLKKNLDKVSNAISALTIGKVQGPFRPTEKQMRRKAQQAYEAGRSSLHSYVRGVLYPEFAISPKIESMFSLPTVSFKRTITITAKTNANGMACWIWNPVFVADTSTNAGYFFYNNDATLDLAGVAGQGKYQCGTVPLYVTAGNFASYRLVGTSVTTSPLVSMNNATGFISQGIMTKTSEPTQTITASFPNGAGTYGPFASAMFQAVFDQALYCQRSAIQPNVSLRHIYVPFDPSFYQFVPVNSSRYAMYSNLADDFFFVGYITGAPANMPVSFDITQHFEFEPSPFSFTESMASKSMGGPDSQKVVEQISKHDDIVSMSSLSVRELVRELDQGLVDAPFNRNVKPQVASESTFDKILGFGRSFIQGADLLNKTFAFF